MSSNQIFGAFDEVNIGSGLVVTNGDLILQTSLNVDAHRMARSTVAATAFASNVEFILYSPLAANASLLPVAGVPPVIYGITAIDAKLNGYVGETPQGYGYCPGDGFVYNNNAQLQYVGLSTYGDKVTIFCDPANPAGATMTVLCNGLVLGLPVPITASSSWLFAGTVSGAPGTYALCGNAGQTPLNFPNPKSTGWWQARATIPAVFLATEPFISLPTDSLPHTKFNGDVERIQSHVIIPRSVKPWPMGQSAPATLGGGSSIEIHLNDPKGIYPQFKTSDVRDLPIVLSRVAQQGSLNAAENVFSAIIDRIDQPTDQTKIIYGVDKLTLAQTQLNRALFGPDADVTVAGKPRPMLIGPGRTFVPCLYDSVNLNYAASDGQLTGFGKERENGKVLAYPGDFTLTADLGGFHRSAAPAGKWTAEATSFGAAFNPATADALAGAGVFGSVGTAGGGGGVNQATGWTGGGGYPNDANNTCWQVLHVAPNKTVYQVNKADAIYWDRNDTFSIPAGASYAYSITVAQIPYIGPGVDANGNPTDVLAAQLSIVGTTKGNNNDANQSLVAFFNWAKFWLTKVGTYTGTFTNPYGGASYITSSATSLVTAGAGSKVFAAQAGLKIAVGHRIRATSSGTAEWMEGAVTAYNIGTGSLTVTMDSNSGTGTHADWVIDVRWLLMLGFLCNSDLSLAHGVEISSVVLNSIPSLTVNTVLPGPGLDVMLQSIYLGHGPYTAGDYDFVGAAAIDAATGYQYGLRVSENESPQVADVAKAPLVSCCSDVFVNRAGKISAVQLIAPENVLIGNVSGSLVAGTDNRSTLVPSEDMAENLTTRLQGCRNYDPYADSDFANVTLADVPLIVRALLKQFYQWIVTAGVALSPAYAAAYNAPPLSSCFDLQTDGQKEITRVNNLYTSQRYFYVGEFFSPIGRQFEIGQVWNVTYPIPGLTTGRQLLILGVEDHPSEGYSVLTFWGL